MLIFYFAVGPRIYAKGPMSFRQAVYPGALCYEAARIMFSHPFNRYAWVAEPPQSVKDYTTPRMEAMGRFCSRIVFLIGHPPASTDGAIDEELLAKYLPTMGSAFVDADTMDLDDITWRMVEDLVPVINTNAESHIKAHCRAPIGELARDASHYRTLARTY